MTLSIAETANKQHKFSDENPRKRCVSANIGHRFTKRVHGLDLFIPKAHLRDSYLMMQETMSLQNRTSFSGVSEFAERGSRDVRTIQRHLAALVGLGVVVRTFRKASRGSNHTSRYTFPILNEDFLLQRYLPGGGDTNVTVKPLPEEKHTTTTTPLPPKGGGEVHSLAVDRTEPQRPVPSAEVHEALQQARELRAQRKTERRSRRHERARESKHSRPEPSPVQQAVRHVMVVLRVCPGLWATRSAIQTSVERWMVERQVCAEAAANALIARWKDYELLSRRLEYPCGMLLWFGGCRWLTVAPSTVRELYRQSEASVGAYRPPPPSVKMDDLREKLRVMLEGVDLEGDEECLSLE